MTQTETQAAPSPITLGRVRARLRCAYNYWVSTAGLDGRPHAAPVWGIWLDDTFYFGTSATSRKGKNLAENPRIIVHLESGDDVIILEGAVERVTDSAEFGRMGEAFAAKYADGETGEPYRIDEVPDDLNAVFYALRPATAQAWLEAAFLTSANRWRFAA